MLNLFNGDGAGGGFPTSRGADTAAEYQRQLDKIVAGLTRLAPDILGLTEIENDGFGPSSALAQLVVALNAAAPAGRSYAAIDASGVDNGTDLIHVAFVFRTQTVTPVGAPAALTNRYFTGISRPPLAQTFRERANNEVLTVTVNHFKSKASASATAAATDGLVPNPNLDQGDGQGASNYVRTRQAQALAQWLATDPTGSGDPDVLIIGDLNAYAKEDPITALRNAGFTNLTEVSEGATGYSYLFNGAFGHLDHALANARLAPRVVTLPAPSVRASALTAMMKKAERTRLMARQMTAIVIASPVMPKVREMTMTPAPTSPRGHMPRESPRRVLNVASSR